MKNTPSLLDLDRQLCFALYSASLAMTKAYKRLLAELGITLTPLAKRLQTLGLIERQRSAVDERHVEISLTAAGNNLRARAEPIPMCVMQLTGCQLPQLASLTRELKDLRNQLAAAARAAVTPPSKLF